MRRIISIIGLFISFYASAQITYDTYCFSNNGSAMMQAPGTTSTSSTIYSSKNGANLPTTGTYRALTIAVNIIYDQTPSANPATSTSGAWGYTTTEGINNNLPSYLLNCFDVDNSTPYNGCVTRFYAESSFNQLIMLSDFMVVNIKQSRITSNNPSGTFTKYALMDAVINYINQNGGLQALYNHNNLADYDFTATAGYGIEKSLTPDNQMDIVNFVLRNTKTNYGDLNAGSGNSYITPSVQIKVNNAFVGYNAGTCQCVGSGDFTIWKRDILTHEYGHFFLGGNEFHTSGGVTVNDDFHNTFIGGQMGYGIFNGGLISCNGYERWRLGWYGSSNNAFPIAANNEKSDILSVFSGERTYLLRDFVTYGDVIRIKLPYKDSEFASNQYIWLENHQSGKNGKLDEPIYNQPGTCRDVAKAGIYSYYQVGKDTLESVLLKNVYPTYEKDNLRIISAEGNYNVSFMEKIVDCLNFSNGAPAFPRFKYNAPNAFNGINQENEVLTPNYNSSIINFPSMHTYMGSKKLENEQEPYDNLPWLGDGNFSAFIPTTSGKILDISSNPSAINTTTYYSTRNSGVMNVITSNRNTRKLYLTGLSIKMIDPDPSNTQMKAYTVKVRWDDYDVKQDVNWTGDIVLKEQLNLLSNKTITLEQNRTPKQINKDAVSGCFDKVTFLTCESNSLCTLQSNSSINLKEKSSFVMNNSSTLSIKDGAKLVVESGSTLQIKAGANISLVGSAKIVIKSGGYICVESGANINLQDYNSLIVMEEGAIYGANPSLFSSPSCSGSITKTGNGSIIDYSQDVYIQNQTISSNKYIGGKNIFVGNHVTTSQTAGDVLINNGANVIFDCKNIVFDPGFECSFGSTYEVKNH